MVERLQRCRQKGVDDTGLQPALVDAGGGASGPQGPFVVPTWA